MIRFLPAALNTMAGWPRPSVGGKQRQFSTKQEARETAAEAADQFLKEYGVITEG